VSIAVGAGLGFLPGAHRDVPSRVSDLKFEISDSSDLIFEICQRRAEKMKFERFEDLPVWKDGVSLAVSIFKITRDRRFGGLGDISNQIQRAGLSVSNNIAEGFERGTTQELVTFLYYARGSAGEVRSILSVIERLDDFADLRSQISDLKSSAESISRQIRGWTASLQNTPIRGQRHLNDRTRAAFEQEKSLKAFKETLAQHYQPQAS
jgi:four helix bundle protein